MTAAAVGGWLLAGFGAVLSLGAVADEIRILRVTEPYARRRLIPPEAHLLALLLTGGGTWLALTWKAALVVLLAHGLVMLGLVTPMLERKLRGD